MAAHYRTQIRDAIATALTGLVTTGANVFSSRVYPLQDAELPALRIYATSETTEASTIHSPGTQHRVTRITVEGIAKDVADLDGTLDQIAKEVEVTLGSALAAFDGTGTTQALVATEIDWTGDAEKPTGRVSMTYEVDWYALENAPDGAL